MYGHSTLDLLVRAERLWREILREETASAPDLVSWHAAGAGQVASLITRASSAFFILPLLLVGCFLEVSCWQGTSTDQLMGIQDVLMTSVTA